MYQLFLLRYMTVIAHKITMYQVNTMLATSENVLFPGHNHLLTTGTDDSTLIITRAPAYISAGGYQVVMTWKYNILEVASMVVTWWIVAAVSPIED